MERDDLALAIKRRIESQDLQRQLSELLVGIMREDTTPRADLRSLRRAESAVFDQLTRAARAGGGSELEISRRPILPEIEKHPYYTRPWYAEGSDRATYEGRSNLVIKWKPQASGPSLAVNSHVDTVTPYIPPAAKGGTIFGRGACDDKGGCVAALGALSLARELVAQGARPGVGRVEFQFVIDEEAGGNGSLSAALDAEEPFDSVIVVDTTDLQIHPANRGAVWYEVTLDTVGNPDVSLAEMALAVVLAIEREGKKIKAESDHPLFPDRPVQTCHAVLGPFGKHPSTVCDEVVLRIRGSDGDACEQTMRMVVESALQPYCAEYGDRTKETEPQTGQAKLRKHYEIERAPEGILLRINGRSGHMGRAAELDNAILKEVFIAQSLPGNLRVELAGTPPDAGHVLLKGAQGFLPTHPMSVIKERIANAVVEGIRAFAEQSGLAFRAEMAKVTFETLHNEAFVCDPESEVARGLVRAAKKVGIDVKEPLVGLPVSCDARIFAHVFPKSAVLTFGPGKVIHAHADDEQIQIADVALAAGALCGFLLGI